MATKRMDARILTEDGILDIEAKMDDYGFITAQLKIGGSSWEEYFSDRAEFKEFINGLPIIQLLALTEYESKVLEPA